MKHQFDHEHHNRQAKVHKPDYKDELRDKPPTYSYTPCFESLKEKREAKEHAVRQMKKRHFFLNGHKHKLGWPIEYFAKVNGLAANEPTTKQSYLLIRSAAELDFEDISSAILKGKVRKVPLCIKGWGRFSSTFSVEWHVGSTRCDEIK